MKNITYEKTVDELSKVKDEIVSNFIKIVSYHNIDEKSIYDASCNINNFFEWIIKFYEYGAKEDKTSKKAVMIKLVDVLKNLDIPIFYSDEAFESPIEHLLFNALEVTMPDNIKKDMFLMPQVSVCNDKYILDIALMLKKDYEKDGTDGVPIVGIECDGFKYHSETPEQVRNTYERVRKIRMMENIEIFQYSGIEIYKDCTKLANEFWLYVESNVLPKYMS